MTKRITFAKMFDLCVWLREVNTTPQKYGVTLPTTKAVLAKKASVCLNVEVSLSSINTAIRRASIPIGEMIKEQHEGTPISIMHNRMTALMARVDALETQLIKLMKDLA